MSYPHRIKVAASVQERVRGRQESRRTIVLDPVVLPRERLSEMLLAELRRRGFNEQSDGALERRRGNAVERVDPQTLVATSAIETEGAIAGSREGFADSKADVAHVRARMEQTIREGAQTYFERELAARVEAAGAEMERELHEAIARVYVEAVQEKAAALGEVASVREERSGSELLLEIRVKVPD